MKHDSETYETIRAVWNDFDNEEKRKDSSHYRGVGRWKDDAAWQRIGTTSVERMKFLLRLAGKPNLSSNHVVLEWGPGGGANLFGFRMFTQIYYGVDISEKNLAEAKRMISQEGYAHIFKPIHLAGAPESCLSQISEEIDLFLSTAVFQHFPSKEYGADVLRTIRAMCKPTTVGFIQIRFDNGNEKFKPIKSLAEYKRKHITANSYRLDEFWNLCDSCGFSPLAIREINTRTNYARYYLSVK